jgi:PIN domain nuclease of toxin-antitoxin system
MSLLLDTRVLLAIARRELRDKYPQFSKTLSEGGFRQFGSVASLWEIAIKVRLGKLDLGMQVEEFASYLASFGVEWISISPEHAAQSVVPEPEIRDPFDRMLLAQCKAEGLQLATVDRELAGHPLAFRL